MIMRKSSNESQDVIQRKIFKTWQEVMSYMQIETVELPWNVDGKTALQILRDKYGKRYKAIHDTFLDDVVEAYQLRSVSEQLNALGEAMLEFKLRFCHLNLNPPQYTVFAVETDNTREYLNLWKEVLTRRQFFNTIDTFAMRRGETLDNPSDDVQIPMSFVQILGAQDGRYSDKYVLDKRFFIVKYETLDRYNPVPIQHLRVYDLNSWPLRQLDSKLDFDRANIEPYTLTIHACDGDFVYVGDDIDRERSWKKTVKNENNQYIPVYEKDEDEDDNIWKNINIGIKKDIQIPDIEDANPLFTIDSHIIYYYYDNDDVDNRQPEDNPGTRSAMMKRRERRKHRNTLLEYDTETQKYRTLNLPGSANIDPDELILYKNTWIIIPDSIFNRDASYIFRLWNPRTHECLRLTQKDMGAHDIDKMIPLHNGDILILLDDGRLCRLNVDLAAWLKEDKNHHGVLLDDWQDETRRSYENFPENSSNRFVRLRRRNASDRMLITFKDGKTYDILLKDNQ